MNTTKKLTLAVFAAIVFAALQGCALQAIKPTDVEAHIDPISVTSNQKLNSDVLECTRFANRTVKKARKKTFLSVLAGALVGAAVGSAVGNNTGIRSSLTAAGAAQGAAVGGAATLPYARSKQQAIVYNCLTHRGYQLLY